jgi:hypothetical protein
MLQLGHILVRFGRMELELISLSIESFAADVPIVDPLFVQAIILGMFTVVPKV